MSKISIQKWKQFFLLSNECLSYGLELADSGLPWHAYCGAPLKRAEDLPAHQSYRCRLYSTPGRASLFFRELSVFGGDFQEGSALKISYPDGIRESIFDLVEAKAEGNTLTLEFREKRHPIQLKMFYTLHDTVLERHYELTNAGTEEVTVENFASATLPLPPVIDHWRVTHLSGRWAREAVPMHHLLTEGKFVVESRTGLSGPFHVPLLALDEGNASEEAGEVYFATVLWSGNWKMVVEKNSVDYAAIHGGINEFDSSIRLHPGETFPVPVVAIGYTREGFGGMSRTLHRYQEEDLLPPGVAHRVLPMLCNTWGSFGAFVNEEKVIACARRAKEIGCELFVIDDGWQAALGDWVPDREKFPRGLEPVREEIARLGMDFGLWIEPESFEISSELYRRHPDWAMAYPNCEPLRKVRDDVGRPRVSVMLNLAKKEVARYLKEAIGNLVRTFRLGYLKLDMNCYFTAPGGAERVWIDYARNLDWIFQSISREFPHLLLENCASGGSRVSLQMTRAFGRINRSDNQDALDVLKLHEGFTFLNLPRMAGGACHISDSMVHINRRQTPLKFQAYCGMLGSLACGKDLARCSAGELAEIRRYVELYKKVRPIVQLGDLYRLVSAFDHPYAVYEYVTKDRSEALVFVLGMSMQFGDKIRAFRVRGLDPDAVYRVESFGQSTPEWSRDYEPSTPISGRAAAQIGIQTGLVGDFDCRILHLVKLKKTGPTA